MMAATVSVLPLVYLAVPPALALPALSLLLLLVGFGLAAVAYLAGHQAEPDRIGPRDVAGALVLLGFAAALLSDAQQALALLDHLHAGAGPSEAM